MAQTWTANCYDPNHTVASDMQSIETNFETLRTTFSGSGVPANPVAGMQWAHAGGVNGLRMRNAANDAWLAVMLGDANSKMWLYRNDAAPGMEIDATVSDRVLAIKGGSQAYNVNGGTGAGSWTISGFTMGDAGSHSHSGTTATNSGSGADSSTLGTHQALQGHTHTYTTSTETAHNHTLTHDSVLRPSAAVGTLQKPILT